MKVDMKVKIAMRIVNIIIILKMTHIIAQKQNNALQIIILL